MEAQKLNKPIKKALRKTDVIKLACVNCGKSKEEHSKATELCPTMFAQFEQAVC
jgi:hypothetical protein